MFGRNIPPHLGGGAILAVRWKHRISTDVDVLLPGRNTLIDLLQDNRPDPPYGHAVATVDGQLEKVLSSHQILCGKLERVDQMLVRLPEIGDNRSCSRSSDRRKQLWTVNPSWGGRPLGCAIP
ncbi:MAG: hypothetical protein OXG35_30725 [Acidobacteria bacterium]|nr:hypothetical protein [Acidobacteriota bacterium]